MEAEIRRRHGLPVSHDPTLSSPTFFLVLSFGRFKYHLSEFSAATILQAVIGGSAELFHVISLGDRVFCFSVSSQAVGLHVYHLRSYECSHFKIFFNLWHNGGPNFRAEYRRWEAEERAQWMLFGKRQSSSSVHQIPLTRANSIPVKLPSRGSHLQISNAINGPNQSGRVSIFKRINFGPPIALSVSK